MPKKTTWTDIHFLFTEEYQQQWLSQGFTYEQTFAWVRTVGLHPNDAYFAAWLRDIKHKDLAWVLNYGNDKLLRDQFQTWKITKLTALNTPDKKTPFFTTPQLLLIVGSLGGIIYLLTKNYD